MKRTIENPSCIYCKLPGQSRSLQLFVIVILFQPSKWTTTNQVKRKGWCQIFNFVNKGSKKNKVSTRQLQFFMINWTNRNARNLEHKHRACRFPKGRISHKAFVLTVKLIQQELDRKSYLDPVVQLQKEFIIQIYYCMILIIFFGKKNDDL